MELQLVMINDAVDVAVFMNATKLFGLRSVWFATTKADCSVFGTRSEFGSLQVITDY